MIDDTRPRSRSRSLTTLEQVEQLTDADRAALRPVTDRYAFRATDYYLSLIDWADPHDPLRRLVVPDAAEDEPWGRLDVSNEAAFTVAPGVQHKYPDTALLLCSDVCSAYCRYCFRKRLFMPGNEEARHDVRAGIDYIAAHPRINNVLLTGGDPLTLGTRRLAEILDLLAAVPHLRVVRIGSKTPAFDPDRIRNDPALLEAFRGFAARGKRLYLIAHFDHPRELTSVACDGLELCLRAGVVCANQCPLIRGVNDDPDTLAELYQRLAAAGCPPYYLFQCRPTAGNAPFSVPIIEALGIFRAALARGSGLARRARFVLSHETGKLEVLFADADCLYFRYHQAADLARVGQVVVYRRDDTAHWLDDLTVLAGQTTEGAP